MNVTLSANPAAVTTVAGNGLDANVDAEGASASFRAMGGAVVVGGYAYVGTQGAIRRVDTATGAVTTLAGHATLTGCVTGTDPGAVRFGVFSDLTTDGTFLYSMSVCPSDPNAYGRIYRTSIATGATSSVAAIARARYLAFGPDGMVYVAATYGSTA